MFIRYNRKKRTNLWVKITKFPWSGRRWREKENNWFSMGKSENGIDFIGNLKLSSDTLIASIFKSLIFLFNNSKQNKNICANCFFYLFIYSNSRDWKIEIHEIFFFHSFLLMWNHDVIPRERKKREQNNISNDKLCQLITTRGKKGNRKRKQKMSEKTTKELLQIRYHNK